MLTGERNKQNNVTEKTHLEDYSACRQGQFKRDQIKVLISWMKVFRIMNNNMSPDYSTQGLLLVKYMFSHIFD